MVSKAKDLIEIHQALPTKRKNIPTHINVSPAQFISVIASRKITMAASAVTTDAPAVIKG
jgi:hypothetical protein